jgi:hypothetical protein
LEGVAEPTQETVIQVSDNPSPSQSAADSPLANLNISAVADDALPVIPEIDQRLLVVMGNTDSPSARLGPGGRLFLASFDGSEPVLLAERVSEPSVIVSPDRTKVAYVAVNGRRWYIYHMDLTTRQSVQLYQLADRFGFIVGWSPDGQWLLFRNGNAAVVSSLDGTIQHPLRGIRAFWLADNQVLGISEGLFFGGNQIDLSAIEVFVLDPTTGERRPLEIDWSTITLDQFAVQRLGQLLADQGFTPASNLEGDAGVLGFPFIILDDQETVLVVDGNAFNNTNDCDTWSINTLSLTTATAPMQIYNVENTLSLSDFQQTRDGSYYFVRWFLEDCIPQAENLRSAVVKLYPDGSVETLADDLYPGISTNFVRISTGHKYSISADERYVVWTSGSLENLTTTIMIKDMVTGTIAPLLTHTTADPNSFLIWEAYNAVFWVH